GILYGDGIRLLPLRDALGASARDGRLDLPRSASSLPALDATDAHLLTRALTHGSDLPSTADLPLSGTAFLRRPRRERSRATLRLRGLKQTDAERWARPDNLDVSWERLPLAAAPLIPPGARVLDL